MKKKSLNEEIVRIREMIGSIDDKSFEKSGPDENIKSKIMSAIQEILKKDYQEPYDLDYELDGYSVRVTFFPDDNSYLDFVFKINIDSYTYGRPGDRWTSSGDVGYPDEADEAEWSIEPNKIVFSENRNIIYEGEDFTGFIDMKFPNGQTVQDLIKTIFDERVQDMIWNQEPSIPDDDE